MTDVERKEYIYVNICCGRKRKKKNERGKVEECRVFVNEWKITSGIG